jgi:hypothetical protein
MYHPIGLDDPDSRFSGPMNLVNRVAAPFGLPSTDPFRNRHCKQSWNRNAFLAVAPTSGFNPTWPAKHTVPFVELPTRAAPKTDPQKNRSPGTEAGNSHGVLCPYDVRARASSLHPGLPTPGTFRPQGFSPSRRFPPRSDVQPCFMPVTPLGFYPSGTSPRCQVPNARRAGNTLLAFLLRIGRFATRMLANSWCRRRVLRGPVPPQTPSVAFRALLQQ